jgi:hypothetical protein
MSSVTGGNNQAPTQAASTDVVPEAGPDPGDLVARALAILQREQARWQASRSENLLPGSGP